MSFVSDAVSGIGNALFGGGAKTVGQYGNVGPAEGQLVSGLQQNLGNLYGLQQENAANAQPSANQFNDLFKQHLTNFLTASQQGVNPTPEQLAQATNFVDQTFTNPTQVAIDKYNSQFADASNAKAAMLGRNPNADTATQAAIYQNGLQNTLGLQQARGAQIAQTAQNFNDQNFSRMGTGLNAAYQGSGFLNNLTQQAFQNQLGLLNQQSSLANYYQRNRIQNQTGQQSQGLLGGLSDLGNGVGGAITGIGQAAGSLGNIFGGGGSGPITNLATQAPELNGMWRQ